MPNEPGRRIGEGPLTVRQMTVLEGLADGLRHAEISREYGLHLSIVREEARRITFKLKCDTSAQAVGVYATVEAYRKAAKLLRAQGIIRQPLGETEEHTNHVVEGLAAMLEQRAEKLLPK